MSDTPAVAIYCAHTELVDIDKLVENPRNPNQHPENVKRLMDGERAILFATDPPYLVGYDGTNYPGTRPKTNTDWSETYGPTWDEADLE